MALKHKVLHSYNSHWLCIVKLSFKDPYFLCVLPWKKKKSIQKWYFVCTCSLLHRYFLLSWGVLALLNKRKKQAEQAQVLDFTLLSCQPPPLLRFAPPLSDSKTYALEGAGRKQFGPQPVCTLGHRAEIQKAGSVLFSKIDTALSSLYLFFLVV